ncbi:hypothetical protein [Streptomyces ipomoeae]|uniref:hypothetical protein n=1 Tax=Streptomyces ipomoeae TaxID=103232 RepID=UPI00031B0C24|nr:hypothetical protein [Streptomyces ipomoeae]
MDTLLRGHGGAPGAAPDAWRRGIGFLLDGLRAEAAHPLSVQPLTPGQMDAVMRELGESGPI